MTKIFYSHTQKDAAFCDAFDKVCARVGIEAFRSELEKINLPAWKTILNEINESSALFLLVGKELIASQESGDPNWKFTQNWISYEIGIACMRGIDVWAVCDDVFINFPMPYINNYCTASIKRPGTFNYFRDFVFPWYNEGKSYPFPFGDIRTGKNLGVICGHKDCNAEFNLHMVLKPKEGIICPQCLRELFFPIGFP